MCRNIKTLFNFDPPATGGRDPCFRAAVRAQTYRLQQAIAGQPRGRFDQAVAEVSDAARRLLTSLHTHAPARDRQIQAEKAKARARARFG